MVEYCLSDIRKPVGVSEYKTTTEIPPKELETMFPTPEQFQHLLDTLPGEETKKRWPKSQYFTSYYVFDTTKIKIGSNISTKEILY